MKIPLITVSLLLCLGAAMAQTNVIFPRQGTIWKYNQTNDLFTDTGIGWTLYNYDDSTPSWQSGPALLSQDTGNANIAPLIQTVILSPRSPTGPTAGNGTEPASHARYFRKKFTYNDPVAPFTFLRLNHRFDDGVIIWLNGVEIGRKWFNSQAAPTHTLRSDCFSCQTGPCTGGGDADCEEVSLFPADQLLQGDNIIAISLHQTGADSSDITFGTSLEVVLPHSPTIVSNSEPADKIVLQNRSHTLQVYATASPAPTYQWYYSTSASGPFTQITDATNSTYTIASMQAANEGYYYVTVANPISSVTSRTAHIQYTEDHTAPLLLNAVGGIKFDSITVQFNEALDPGTAQDPFSWGVTDDLGNAVELDSNPPVLSADRSVVTLLLVSGTFLQQNKDYTVAVSGVTDSTGQIENTIDPTNFTFRTYTTAGCNSFLLEAFDTRTTNAAGNAVSLLTSHTNYPNNPREAYNLPSFDTRNILPQGSPDPQGRPNESAREDFGGRVRGLFVPNVTGPWVFYLASDDNGELWVNPNGPDSAGRQRVARETGCCNPFMPQGSIQTSVPINLTAGRAYYVEGLYKEGGGGDWLKVAARPAGEPVPVGGNTEAGSISPNVIQGGAGPAGILSFVTIGTQPANQAVMAGGGVAFTVQLSPDVPGCFQWKRDGVDIAGANGQSYWIPATSLADNGAKFSVAISLMGGTGLTSSEATLTVTNDVVPPTVGSVSQNLVGQLTVTFSEPVDSNTATNPANYAIDGVAPLSASVSGATVLLTPSTPVAQCPLTHNLSVSNVKDRFNNTVSPNPTLVPFTVNGLLVVPINAGQSWRYDDFETVDLGDAWYTAAFNDSTWSNGAPSFSFPATEGVPVDLPVRTTLSGVRLTTYFRTHFNLASDPSTVTNLQLNVVLDDGGVFYLNGHELTRIRMAPGTLAFDTLTTAGQPGADPPQILETYNLLPDHLLAGDNVLAVRVHQSSTGSSDTVLSAGLIAQVSACGAPRPRLAISRNGNQVTITSTGPGTIYKATSLTGTWSVVGAAPQTLTVGTGSLFFEIRP